MPSPRCNLSVNRALSFVPSTWKCEAACRFAGTGVAGRGTATGGLDGSPAGVLDLVAGFGLDFVAGFDLLLGLAAGLVLRLAALVLDCALALLLVFAAALTFGLDFVFFLATMRAPLLSGTTASHASRQPRQKQKDRWTGGR